MALKNNAADTHAITGTNLELDITALGQLDGEAFGQYGAAAEVFEADLWKSAALGDIGYLKPFFEAAKKALELHKANSAFIKEIYEINKALMFATIDPIFAAIDAILDEILAILKDLRGLGFYMLPVHAGSVEPNVERNPMTGALFFGKNIYVPATRIGPTESPVGSGKYQPAKLDVAGVGDKIAIDPITGEQNYVEAPEMSEDPLLFKKGGDTTGVVDNYYIKMNKYTGLMSLTPGGIIQTIDKSFDDLGDVPKFFKQAIADGTTESKLDEWIPNVDINKFSDLIDPSYYKSGRPIMSDSAKVGGIIFIIGLPDFDKFSNVLTNFNKLIEIKGFVELLKDIKKIWKPAAVSHKLLVSKVAKIVVAKGAPAKAEGREEVRGGGDSAGDGRDTDFTDYYVMQEEKSGAFTVQDPKKTNRILKNDRGVYGRVKAVVETKSWINEVMVPNASSSMDSQDVDMTESRIKAKHIGQKENRNPLPYMNQTLEIEYLESGSEEFVSGELIYEAIPSVASGIKGEEGKVIEPDDQREATYHQVKEGECVVGMVVDAYDDNALPESPNWSGKSLEQLIPALGPMLNKCEAEVKGIKSSVASAKKTLDPIIKWLDDKIEDVLAFAADIEVILDLFANGLPAAGMYSLYLEPRVGGITTFRERMNAAGGELKPPEDLKFCAGVCFLGGGPDDSVLLRGIDMLALLMGLRVQTAAETKVAADMKSLAIDPYAGPGTFADDGTPNTKVYSPPDEVFFSGKNFECILTTEDPDDASAVFTPLIQDTAAGSTSGMVVVNSKYWKMLGDPVGDDEAVTVGDSRPASELAVDKKAWLTAAKAGLEKILELLEGQPTGTKSILAQIMEVNLFGSFHPITEQFQGDDINIYEELLMLRDNDLRELELLVFRIKEMLQIIEISLIQTTQGMEDDETVEKGSIRTKGKTLMIIKGEFVDEVDGTNFNDFGHREVKPNTTITIFSPLLESSGSTRSVESLSNTTVAVLDEAFPVDLDTSLSYNIPLNSTTQRFEPYASADENKITNAYLIDGVTSSPGSPVGSQTHYIHPGYRLRAYKAKANTVSIAIPTSAGKYPQLPVWRSGEAGVEGDVRTTANYPAGTVLKINGTVPVSETYISDDTGLEIVRTEEEQAVADTWMALGVAEGDEITIVFDGEDSYTRAVDHTIGEEYLKLTEALVVGSSVSMFQFHEEWSFEISAESNAEAVISAAIQKSRNKFKKLLEDVSAQAEEVYEYLDTINAETWPKLGTAADNIHISREHMAKHHP